MVGLNASLSKEIDPFQAMFLVAGETLQLSGEKESLSFNKPVYISIKVGILVYNINKKKLQKPFG